ncbi:hypothetical protein L1987_86382 [Smallanthus sonchifolius]|uniref:Uncharacterized protein n=1 Tax=Smallanthus sonchifolius TaxID=185202 RepID=A0ACB8XZN6_9ASTR|nr:hypothetical protein L1987_86382 [Smallanthus sonchifolius]
MANRGRRTTYKGMVTHFKWCRYQELPKEQGLLAAYRCILQLGYLCGENNGQHTFSLAYGKVEANKRSVIVNYLVEDYGFNVEELPLSISTKKFKAMTKGKAKANSSQTTHVDRVTARFNFIAEMKKKRH